MRKFLFLTIFLITITFVGAFDLDLSENIEGNLEGKQGEIKRLSLDGEQEHTITFTAVGPQRSMITVNPGNKVVVLDVSQSKEILLDDQNLNFTFIGPKEDKAAISVEKIQEKLIQPVIANEEPEIPPLAAPVTGEATGIESLLGNSKIVYGVIVVILLIIIIAFISSKSGSAEKYYNKAQELHKEAEEFHRDGDSETAEELLKKSEELRKKAREIEFK